MRRTRYSEQMRAFVSPEKRQELDDWADDHQTTRSDTIRRFIDFGLRRLDWPDDRIQAYHTPSGREPLGHTEGMLFVCTARQKEALQSWASSRGLAYQEALRIFLDFGLESYPNRLVIT